MQVKTMKRQIITGFFLIIYSASFCVYANDRVIPVSVASVISAPLYEEVPLSGTVEARRVSSLSPRVEGFVTELLVDEGDQVKTGEPMLELDPILVKIGLERVRAQFQEAQASLIEAKRQRDEAAELVKKKHVSATSFEAREAEVAIKSAVLKRLQSDVNQQREVLARHTVYAPFDGVVSKKLVEVGQWVETSSALLELVEINILRIEVPVPQLYFSRIRIGTEAKIRLDAYPEESFVAQVSMIIPNADASSRIFPVRLEISNENNRMTPGMSARVRLQLNEDKQTIMVPRDAVVRKPDGSGSVWKIVSADGQHKVKMVSVTTGGSSRGQIGVLNTDLKAGDKVVVRGNEILRAEQSVSFVDAQ